MYYMEALMGQFTSKSFVGMWSACPLFSGKVMFINIEYIHT